jgi:hypothetical protein
MRTRLPAIAACAAIIALGASPAALAASTARHDRAAGAVRPSVTNPGDAEPSLSLSVSPSGEPEIATIGPSHSLWFSYDSGGSWHHKRIASKDSAYSAPSLIAGPAGTANLAVEGADHALEFYHRIGGSWHRRQVARKGSAYSAPALAEGDGKTGIAVEGPHRDLVYYGYASGKWHRHIIQTGVVASAPALAIRGADQAAGSDPAGEADIAVRETSNELWYYYSLPVGWQSSFLGGADTTYSAPALTVLPASRGVAVVAVIAEGASHSLEEYANDGSGWTAGHLTTLTAVNSALSLAAGNVAVGTPISYQGASHSLPFIDTDQNLRTAIEELAAPDSTAYSAPSLAFRVATGETDIAVQGQSHTLMYCSAPAPGSNGIPDFSCRDVADVGTTYGG